MSEDSTLDEFAERGSDSPEPEAENLTRKTVCGIPPQGWNVARLGELVRVVSGNSLPTEYQNGKEGEHPIYKVSDMNATGNRKYVSDSSNRLSKEALEEISHTLYPEGTTILPKVGAALLTNKRRVLTEPSSFDNNVMGWVPDEINPEFLYYVSCMIDMEAVAQKGAVPSISKAIAKSLKLPSPSLPEQCKIATVLYTVDRAIELTEQIESQIRRTQKGIVQEALRCGLGDSEVSDTGEKLGGIPTHWEITTIDEIVADEEHSFTDGARYALSSAEIHDEGEARTILLEEVGEGEFNDEDPKFATGEKYEEITHRAIYPGEVVVAKMAEPVARACIVPDKYDKYLLGCADVVRIQPNDEFDSRFLKYCMNSHKIWRQAVAHLRGTGRSRINLENIAELKLPKPPLNEQIEIADTLESFDKRIVTERDYRDNLRRLKRGLMQDLLSGKVRTTDTNIAVPDEITQHG